MVENADAQPPFAAWYLLRSIFDNPNAACLTSAFVTRITTLTRARRPE
jgi:hypothetical protein